MQVVNEQEMRDELVFDRVGSREQPRERLAVEVDDGLHRLDRTRIVLDRLEELLDPLDVHVEPPIPSIGECTRFSVLPLPRYMWTPHGRHGSKLRTVRMMSIPRKLSRSFSSNS